MARDFILEVKGVDMQSCLPSNHSASNMYKISLEQFIPAVILQFEPQNDRQLCCSGKGSD